MDTQAGWYVSLLVANSSREIFSRRGPIIVAHVTIGIPRFISKIKPRMYVRLSTLYEKAEFCWRKISSVACELSSVKIHFSANRINEVYVFSIKYFYSDISLKKHKLHL